MNKKQKEIFDKWAYPSNYFGKQDKKDKLKTKTKQQNKKGE